MGTPPIPGWDGLHPLIIHFPIALLLVAPLFVVMGMVAGRRYHGLVLAALVLMALGTASAYLAVGTGEAAAVLADRTPGMAPVLAHHQELAERVRLVFTGLTALFAALVFLPALLKRELKPGLARVCFSAFLCLYAVGALGLADTAHNGGRLVHEFGVRALIAASPVSVAIAANRP